MVSNVETIRGLLKFPSKDHFYFVEVIKRRKENPEMENHASLIKDFYIYSFEEFDKLVPKMIDLCNLHNARAYFRLNLRNAKKVALEFNKRIAEMLITNDFKNMPRAYSSVAGEFKDEPDKTWVIDLDGDEALPSFYTVLLNEVTRLAPNAIVALIPTLNGLHVISRPFRLDAFKKVFPKIDVHKDNPTILYAP